MVGSTRLAPYGVCCAVALVATIVLVGMAGAAGAEAGGTEVGTVDGGAVGPQSNCPGGMDGGGTADDPCLVEDVEGLEAIGDDPTAETYYALAGNVDAGGATIDPIGSDFEPFEGYFDGQGYAISNLVVTSGSSPAGLFGAMEGGLVENLVLANVVVNGQGDAGALAGINRAVVFNVTAAGSIETADGAVGGLIGENDGLVERSAAAVSIEEGGGLVGINRGEIRDSYAVGEISDGGAGLIADQPSQGIDESSYWDVDATGAAESDGENDVGLSTDEMQGLGALGGMERFDFHTEWIAPWEEYPVQARFVEDATLHVESETIEVGEKTDVTVVVDLTVGESVTVPAAFVVDDQHHDAVTIDDEDRIAGEDVGEAVLTLTVLEQQFDQRTVTVVEEDDDDGGDDGDNGSGDDDGNGDHPAPPPSPPEDDPEATVTDAVLQEGEIEAGGELVVEATVEGDGDCTDCPIDLRLDDEVVSTTTVSLSDGEQQTIELSHAIDEPGEYEVTVGAVSLDQPVSVVATTDDPADDEGSDGDDDGSVQDDGDNGEDDSIEDGGEVSDDERADVPDDSDDDGEEPDAGAGTAEFLATVLAGLAVTVVVIGGVAYIVLT